LSPPKTTSVDPAVQVARIETEATAAEAKEAWKRKQQEAEDTLDAELLKGRWASENELNKLFHTTVAEVAKGAIDRSRDSAKHVQVAASAILPIYTGVLALAFSVTENPLPVRGVFAAVFLGLAVALSTGYLAFLTRAKAPELHGGGGSLAEMQFLRTGYLTKLVNATVYNRRWMMHAAVVSLVFGAALLPAAFISSSAQVKVPDAPAAPAIPGEVASGLEDRAIELFDAQVAGFKEAVKERNEAIAAAASEAEKAEADNAHLNEVFAWVSVGALFLVFAIPGLIALATPTDRNEGEIEPTEQER
jgi:hypothetical protein